MNDEIQERLSYASNRTYCLALKPGHIDFPPRCTKSPSHTTAHRAWAGLGANDFITWEDDEHHN